MLSMADGIIHPVAGRTLGIGIASRQIRGGGFFKFGIDIKTASAQIKHISISCRRATRCSAGRILYDCG